MNRFKAYFIFVPLALFSLLCQRTNAETITAASCSQEAVQAAVDSAQNGDTVRIPACSDTWTSPVRWTNKNIAVIGAGIDKTDIATGGGQSAEAFSITMTTGSDGYSSAGTPVKKVSWRLSGMTISGTTGADNPVVYTTSTGYDHPVQGWRIDHIKFDFPSTAPNDIAVLGISWGLIDHCQFLGKGIIGIEIRAYYDNEYRAGGQPYLGNTTWAMPLHLGSDEAVYVEDCTFNYNGVSSAVDIGMGGGCVFRHNDVTGTAFFAHGTESGLLGRGGKKFEIYDNTFKYNGDPTDYPVFLAETSTGVIFNNTISGYEGWGEGFIAEEGRAEGLQNAPATGYYGDCTGNSSGCPKGCVDQADGDIEASGWPCLDQLGRGPAVATNWPSLVVTGELLNTLHQPQPSVPIITWNNGPQATCARGNSCDGSIGIKLGSGSPVNTNYTLANYISASPHKNGDVDYCNGGTRMPRKCGNYTNTYKPFRYPYPWPLSSSQSTFPAPTGLHLRG